MDLFATPDVSDAGARDKRQSRLSPRLRHKFARFLHPSLMTTMKYPVHSLEVYPSRFAMPPFFLAHIHAICQSIIRRFDTRMVARPTVPTSTKV